MKRYLDHIKSKSPHHRRQHASQIAAGIIAAVALVWISTLGLRFASIPAQTADDSTASQLANVASGADAANGQATLIVATTTGSGGN